MIAKIDTIVKNDSLSFIRMQQPYFKLLNIKPGRDDRFMAYLENAYEFIDQPGEWYYDQKNEWLYYMPSPSTDMNKAEVIIPQLEILLKLKGSIENPLQNITFKGITFSHASWMQPSQIGHLSIQSNFTMPVPGYKYMQQDHTLNEYSSNDAMRSVANIILEYCKNSSFINCTFEKLGGAGIDIQKGSSYNRIDNCNFFDISGSGIQIGDVLSEDHHPSDNRNIVKGNVITNCLISRVACEYEDGVGVFVGFTDSTIIDHNEISYLTYSGISVGWGWGSVDFPYVVGDSIHTYTVPAISQNNLITNNYIHHVMLKRADGAGIYTLGRQKGTLIRENVLHSNLKAHDIYLDEGSAEIRVERNTIRPTGKTKDVIKLHTMSDALEKSCIIRDNIILSKEAAELIWK